MAISQVGLIGTNIGAYWWKRSYISEHSGQIANKTHLGKYKVAQGIQIGALAVLGATYLFGVIDAFIHMGK